MENIIENAPVPAAETQESEKSSVKKNGRRTNAQIAADEKAARDAIKNELLIELQEQGLLKDDVEVQADMEKAALEALPFADVVAKIKSLVKAPKDLQAVAEDGRTYSFRNAETILMKAKPVCRQFGCDLLMDEKVQFLSDMWVYQVATATIVRISTGESVSAQGAARECPQPGIGNAYAKNSGAAQSYAKKYALCNLFAIDDSKDDPDMETVVKAPEAHGTTAAEKAPAKTPDRTDDAVAKMKAAVKAGTRAVEMKPAEAKPAEAKPAEAKPAEAKAVEMKPANAPAKEGSEVKPAETKPAEVKPTETKSAEAPAKEGSEVKPAEVKPAEVPAGENTSLPALVPGTREFGGVVTGLASHPDITDDDARLQVEKRFAVSDEVWNMVLEKTGRKKA